MALWDQLKSRLTDLQSNTKTQVGKYKSKDFAKASMAMCALIAAADGTISPEERRKTAAFIGSNDVLSVEAIATIGKLKGKPDAARAVIQVGIIIGGADGNFDKDEQQAVREACNAVGIPPAEFDL
jgi:tellurite resistance protein TerB